MSPMGSDTTRCGRPGCGHGRNCHWLSIAGTDGVCEVTRCKCMQFVELSVEIAQGGFMSRAIQKAQRGGRYLREQLVKFLSQRFLILPILIQFHWGDHLNVGILAFQTHPGNMLSGLFILNIQKDFLYASPVDPIPVRVSVCLFWRWRWEKVFRKAKP